MDLKAYLAEAVERIHAWEATWGPYDRHPSLAADGAAVQAAFAAYAERLQGNYPFFHPCYAGQMLKPPHPVAVLGYVTAMLINPNNHALDGGPPTAAMEVEAVRALADMFHLPPRALGHLTSSGTVANLEALWVARELHPDKAVAVSREAHYTHGRMGQVLGLPMVTLPVDESGRLCLDALESQLRTGAIGTVVLTAGTTGLGAVDPIDGALALCRTYDCRIHVDAAYGGFFAIEAWSDAASCALSPTVAANYRAIAACDSVVVDPHKHGLQPYGCGCVLFRDASVGRFYQHDSPYTYFTSDALHLGEITLECSRAGAAAGALWLTLQVLPLYADNGFGPILRACLRAARAWHSGLEASEELLPYVEPELDIVTYYPSADLQRASTIDAASEWLYERAFHDPDGPVFLSKLRIDQARLARRHPALVMDQEGVRILRSVLMRPEAEHIGFALLQRLETWAREGLESSANGQAVIH